MNKLKNILHLNKIKTKELLLYKHYNFSIKIKIKNLKICEENKNNEVLITTPIFYVNSNPHIGHLYTAILATAIKETNLIMGKKAYLSTGTDEHGLKIQQKAKENKIETQIFCDINSQKFRDLFDKAKINYDDFIRTTEERHKEFVSDYWNELDKKNKIKSTIYSGYYSISDESFIPEKDLIKQDNGTYLTKLNQAVEYIKEENYGLCFNEDDLIDEYKSNIEKKKLKFLPESLINEVTEYINNKLFDICISRPYKRVNWGIKINNNDKHVIYVWFEALLNYLTVVKNLNLKLENLEMINLIGKDISKFHCYFWPLILQMGNKFPNKLMIIMHDHWLKKEIKMSKSLGNVVDPFKLIDDIGIDPIRFYFLGFGPQNHDVNFEEENIRDLYYKYIPDSLTNLLLRLSNPKVCDTNNYKYIDDNFTDEELTRIRNLLNLAEKARESLMEYDYIACIHKIHLILIELNTFVHTTEYWKNLVNKNYVSKIFCVIIEFVRIISILLKPILPELSKNINNFIGIDEKRISLQYSFFRLKKIQMFQFYHEETLEDINIIDDSREFLESVEDFERGYFSIDLIYKDKIFINKVKHENIKNNISNRRKK